MAAKGDWRAEMLEQLRGIIMGADAQIVRR